MKLILVESFLTPADAQGLLASVQSLPWTRGRFMGRALERKSGWGLTHTNSRDERSLPPLGHRKLKPSELRLASSTAAITTACCSIATRMSRIASPGIPTTNRKWIQITRSRLLASAPHANFWFARSRARTPCNHTSSFPEAFSSCRPDFSRDTSTASRNRRRLAPLE